MKQTKLVFTALSILILMSSAHSDFAYKIAKVKYKGGGDWYANKTALPNLVNFCNQNLKTNINPSEAVVEVGSPEIFNYPWIYLTGHGNVVFSDKDVSNLRKYLEAGGFLHIDDNYGLKPFIEIQMKKVFPELSFVELPFSHPIYHQTYKFNNGLPKIHEHDGKTAQGFGLILKGKLVCFFSYEADLGNGWEDASVHNDPEEKRQLAFKMGANIIQYAFNR
ncbi:MAG: DUF4159 domain-containing protein [Bacteroidota bacterium]|nr:DUF4159 domain-containing protein [Bacteroidota bacterium]